MRSHTIHTVSQRDVYNTDKPCAYNLTTAPLDQLSNREAGSCQTSRVSETYCVFGGSRDPTVLLWLKKNSHTWKYRLCNRVGLPCVIPAQTSVATNRPFSRGYARVNSTSIQDVRPSIVLRLQTRRI